jgi:hypothetical protein
MPIRTPQSINAVRAGSSALGSVESVQDHREHEHAAADAEAHQAGQHDRSRCPKGACDQHQADDERSQGDHGSPVHQRVCRPVAGLRADDLGQAVAVTGRVIREQNQSDEGAARQGCSESTPGAAGFHVQVWWLWPNTCLMRYPGRSSMIVLHIVPVAADRTLETYDFFLETPEPDELEKTFSGE